MGQARKDPHSSGRRDLSPETSIALAHLPTALEQCQQESAEQQRWGWVRLSMDLEGHTMLPPPAKAASKVGQ